MGLWYRILLFSLISCSCSARTFSPLDFGYLNATSGEQRYNVLYKTHVEAFRVGANVDYSGINRVDLVIPNNAKSIPLTEFTDFRGAVFHVKNNQKDIYLFTMVADAKPFEVNKRILGESKFKIPRLDDMFVLLSVYDKTPWVENRRGYSYGATRKDIIIIKNGKMMNTPVMPYNNKDSTPICTIYPFSTRKKIFKSIKLIRSTDSDYKTFLLKVVGQYNILIDDIHIKTPNSTMYADVAISVDNCAKVYFRNVTIDGTYSQKNKYGYGISLHNVYDATFDRLKATAKWGIFGNSNVQKVVLTDCDINRFDIHCYGKDIYFKNSIFRDLYNQFSSLYGTLKFEGCRFVNSVPVLFESSYSAYTHFVLEILDCSIEVNPDRPYLIHAGNPSLLAERPREELASVHWPDISIKNLTVYLPKGIKNWTIFQINGDSGAHISGMSNVIVKGLSIRSIDSLPRVRMVNKKIILKNKTYCKISRSNISSIE